MALLRPLSGSGAFGYMTELVNTAGPDTYVGYLVSTMQGSTETTFYVVAVYFGAVQVSRLRHTIPAALTADFTGVVAAVVICLFLFGHARDAGPAPTPTAEIGFAENQVNLSRRLRQSIDDTLVPFVEGHPGACFQITGSADPTEIPRDLASARAGEVQRYLIDDWELARERIETATAEPVDCERADDPRACHAANRTVRVATVPCAGDP